MKLRPYQLRLVKKIRASIKSGKPVVLISPVGAGKVKPP